MGEQHNFFVAPEPPKRKGDDMSDRELGLRGVAVVCLFLAAVIAGAVGWLVAALILALWATGLALLTALRLWIDKCGHNK